MIGQIRKRDQQSDPIYYTLLKHLLGFAVPFTSFKELYENAGQKSFWWDKLACFEFSSSNFNLLGYILSTGVVALRASPLIVVV